MAWLFLDSMGWRFLAIITSLPVGLSLASAYFLVESPRWLIGKGRMKEAQAVMHVRPMLHTDHNGSVDYGPGCR